MKLDAIQHLLTTLGDYNGAIDGDIGPKSMAALTKFQLGWGLTPDAARGGWAGPLTIAALEQTARLLKNHAPIGASEDLLQLRNWRFTGYYNPSLFLGTIPVRGVDGKDIARLDVASFCRLALEGSGNLPDGRVLNVAGSYIPCDTTAYTRVVAYADQMGWLPSKPGYAGIQVKRFTAEGPWQATHVFAFKHMVGNDLGKFGFPKWGGIDAQPYKTAATDCGRHSSADPKYRATGGVIPTGTKFWILEWCGKKLPDGSTHDGWFTANDSGGGIEGNQCDLFCGDTKGYKTIKLNPSGHLWYQGIEARLPQGYAFGK